MAGDSTGLDEHSSLHPRVEEYLGFVPSLSSSSCLEGNR